MYGILGNVVNEASRVQTKHDLSFKSLLQNSPYWKDVLRIFAMPGIKTSWSNFRWRQLVEEGPVKQRSLKDPFNSIKENCSSGIQCDYTREASLTSSLPGVHVLPVVAYSSLCWWRGWARADNSLRYLLGLPLLLLGLATTGILFPFVGKYVETGMEMVIRCVLER